ncbi:unnamed protein product [Lota lota]
MEAVNAFNQELFSLMDSKPPISRAKMVSITKSAIKAMKLYKHVVQIVEKFVKKCKPEYKVSGLYVVDSIVRQSRHQFGADKDVFGPRFTKNINGTFENLCLCPMEDRSKLVRVLNLWQKNGVFKIEVIQPLLAKATGSGSGTSSFLSMEEPGSPPSPAKEPVVPVMENSTKAAIPQLPNSDALAAVAQLFQSSEGQQLQQMLQNFQQQPLKPQMETQTQPAPPQPHLQNFAPGLGMGALHPPLSTQTAQQKAAFDRKLLDRFDYDDEPETGEETKKDEALSSQPSSIQQPGGFHQNMELFSSQMMGITQDPSQQGQLPNGQLLGYGLPPGRLYPGTRPPMGQAQPGPPMPGSAGAQGFPGAYPSHNAVGQQDMEVERSGFRESRHSRRSHSGSRSPKRRSSRSNSRTRRTRHRRSRSRDRRHHSPHSRSAERQEREKERERRQKGLPQPIADTLSVCSTTLWVGQLDKRTQQQDVACLLEEFGPIDSINMIPPRGCAYIVMVERQDAYRALQKLGRGNHKVNQKAIKIAWALNKGIKPDLKQYWDVELGVTYIPWSKIREDQLEEIQEGGMLDVDTLSPEWKGVTSSLEQQEELPHNGRSEPPQSKETPGPPAHPPQGPLGQLPMVGPGSLQLPGFPGPMGMPPPSFPPGVPPPPFIRPGFSRLQMATGFPPAGGMPLGPPPPGQGVEDPSLDPAGLANRNGDEEGQHPFNNQMGPMGQFNIQLFGPPGTLPPIGGLLGARPGIIPLQRPPGLPPPHMQRFPPPHGPRPPHPNMPPMLPQMLPRGPHLPMMRHDLPPPLPGGFGMMPPHIMRGPFPPHGPPPPGLPPPPPFVGPAGPPPGTEESDDRPFRGGRPGFREPEAERERDWERDRERNRGFAAGRRPFDGGRGADGERVGDGRERLGGWQEDGGNARGGGWDRDRERERDGDRDRDRDRDRERNRDRERARDPERDRDRDRDRERHDWRERRGSQEADRDRGRVEDGERERGRGEGGERGRGERRGAESKDRDRPRRSERRERSSRWDNDDRLAELENMDRLRNSESTEPAAAEAVELPEKPSKELVREPSEQKTESEPCDAPVPAPSDPSQSDRT